MLLALSPSAARIFPSVLAIDSFKQAPTRYSRITNADPPSEDSHSWIPQLHKTRRSTISRGAAAVLLPTLAARADAPYDRGSPFEWTSLWKGAVDNTPKQSNLTASEVASILQRDLSIGKYPLTGNLTAAIFNDDCRFVDPNNAVNGLSKYRQAVSLLFRPEQSSVNSVTTTVVNDKTILADYNAFGVLKLPWKPKIDPWSGQITYTLDDDGLIVSQVDVWNISRFDAIRQTFTPG